LIILSVLGEAVRPEREFAKRLRDDGLVVIDKAELDQKMKSLGMGQQAKKGDLSEEETQSASEEQVTNTSGAENVAHTEAEHSEGETETTTEHGNEEAHASNDEHSETEAQQAPEHNDAGAQNPAEHEEEAHSTTQPGGETAQEAPGTTLQEEGSQDEPAKTNEDESQTAFFQEVIGSHAKLDHALETYKEVADKGEQRAAEAFEKLGDYKTSITNLRSPLQQISSQVKQLHTQIVKKMQADEKERMAPLNSLQEKLSPATNASKDGTESSGS